MVSVNTVSGAGSTNFPRSHRPMTLAPVALRRPLSRRDLPTKGVRMTGASATTSSLKRLITLERAWELSTRRARASPSSLWN